MMMTLLLLTSALARPTSCRWPCEKLLPPLATSVSSPISAASSLPSPSARAKPLRFSAAQRTESSCVPCGSRLERRLPEKRVGSCRRGEHVRRATGWSERGRGAHLRHEREAGPDRVEVGVGQSATVDVDRAVRGQDEAQEGECCEQGSSSSGAGQGDESGEKRTTGRTQRALAAA